MKSLALVCLLAGVAAAGIGFESVTLRDGTKAVRFRKEKPGAAIEDAALITPHFSIYYERVALADAWAEDVGWALERSWSTILDKMHFRVPKGHWMRTARIPVYINELGARKLGVATRRVSLFGSKSGKIDVNLRNRVDNTEVLYATCAHELFHLVQYAHDAKEDHWILDATAVWMEDKAFPARARANPNDYGARFYESTWNVTYHLSLFDESRNHAYADSFFIQYLTEQTGDALVWIMWDKMRAVEGDNTGAAIEASLGGKNVSWGDEFRSRYRDFAIANLIRDPGRAPSKRYAFGLLKKPLPHLRRLRKRTFAGLSLFGATERSLRVKHRFVRSQAMKYDELVLPSGVRPGPVDVGLLIRSTKDDGWGYAAVVDRPRGKWTVEPFEPTGAGEWTTHVVRVADPARERLYLVWARPQRDDTITKAPFTAVILSPPVVTRFEIHEPDPYEPRMRPVWTVERRPYDRLAGRAYRTVLAQDRGLTWRETQSRQGKSIRLRVETSGPVIAPVHVVLEGSGKTLDVALPEVAGRPQRFEAGVPLSDLDPLTRGTDRLAVRIRARDSLGRGLDGKPSTVPGLDPADRGQPAPDWLDGWEGGPLDGAIRGGTDDLGGRPVPVRREKALPVEVDAVRAAQDGKARYDAKDGTFRPCSPGRLDLEIVFRRNMDRSKPPVVSLGGTPATGAWSSARVWKGAVDRPHDAGNGWQVLSVAAVADDQTPLDADPKTAGAQPDKSVRVLYDTLPVYVREVEVTAAGTNYYSAHWRGGADLALERSVTTSALDGRRARELVVRRSQTLPAAGSSTLFVTVSLSGAVPRAPAVRIGGVPVEKLESKKGRFWMGEVSLAAVRKAVPEGAVAIEIEASDATGRGLDADPRTVPAVVDGTPWWTGFESEPGGASEGKGGADRWHRIETPPRMSYVLILDASGSMKEQNRLGNAKQAIHALLEKLPADVEMGLVVFFSPDNIQVKGFTRDRERIRKWVDAAEPDDGTPLAAAIDRARELLADRSHPASRIWRYRVFSDGKETGGGDPVAALRRLDAAIARRRGEAPPPRPPRVPPPKQPTEKPVACHPQEWQGFLVGVERHRPFDWIFLVEVLFEERALPDGRCMVRLEERPFGVAYGASRVRGERRVLWRVHDRPDEVRVEKATSDQGEVAVNRIRARFAELKKKCAPFVDCNRRIDALVRENLK